ncbi:MAG: histidine kinase [Actinomycetota bacterium]
MKSRLARSIARRDPAKALEVLGQIEAETQEALEDLRDLARGIYPPLLADKGLAGRPRGAGAQVTPARDGRGRRCRAHSAGDRGGCVLLRPRGSAEHGEVR